MSQIHTNSLLLFLSSIYGMQISAFWLHKFFRNTGTDSIESEKRIKELLKKELIFRPSEGAYAITELGQAFCDSRNLRSEIDTKTLEKIDLFIAVVNKHNGR